MRRIAAPLLLALTLVSVASAQDANVPLVAPTEALSAAEQQKMFRLPPGFEIQLIAQEPEIQKPMNMAFDAAGRLFVTQSVEYPFPAKQGKPRDTIKLIVDTNGDGVPDKVSTFADGLNIPIGVLPLTNNVVIGYGIPNIYRFEDADGDGVAEKREILYRAFGSRDTHGMSSSYNWWLDGWVHGCHGFLNDSKVEGADGRPVTMNSGNTYRFRTDGSHIEQYTWGQVNPFGMMFDPLGNVYTADCHSKPIYMLLRGAYYPSFGKPHDGLGYGPEMIAHSHGSTGICGVVYYAARNFPEAYRDTVFIGNPVTGRINHDHFEAHGSSYRAIEQPDFLSCEDLWFRPVDMKLAPDGSIYVADFYNCIIGHYEVDLYHPRRDREKGRIWRIVYTGADGAKHTPAPDLAKASAEQLVEALGSTNITVRTLAVHQLAERVGKPAVEAVSKTVAEGTPFQRAYGLWVLRRLGALDPKMIERLAANQDRMVRVHVIKALAGMEWNRPGFRPFVAALLSDSDAFVRRAAADALGQHPHIENIEPLLALWERTPADDTHLIHVARISLRDTLASIGDLSPLTATYAELPDRYRRLADVALGAPTPEAAGFLWQHLPSAALDQARLPEIVEHVIRRIPAETLPRVYEFLASRSGAEDVNQQVAVLRSIQRASQARGAEQPAGIRDRQAELTRKLLASNGADAIRTGVELAREFQVASAVPTLETLAARGAQGRGVRLPALEALVALDAPRATPLLSVVLESGDEPIPLRQKSGELLASLHSPASRAELARLLPVVPDSVAVVIARGLAQNKEEADLLLGVIEQGKAAPRLLQDGAVAERLKSHKVPELAARLEKLLADLPSEDERTQKLLAARQAGFGKARTDAAKGAEVFKKICANCHRVNGTGSKIGPDLDGIGSRGLERLLEDVLLPSRNVDQAFRATSLLLDSGKTLTGLAGREEGEVLVLVNEQGKEVRVPMKEIDERQVLKISPMPSNIAEQLGDEDFHHLLSYLLSLKGTAPVKPATPR